MKAYAILFSLLFPMQCLLAQEPILNNDTVYVGINEPAVLYPAANDILPDGSEILGVYTFLASSASITYIPDDDWVVTGWSVTSVSLLPGWDSVYYKIRYVFDGDTMYSNSSNLGTVYIYNFVGEHNDTLDINPIQITLNKDGEIAYDKFHSSNNDVMCNIEPEGKSLIRKNKPTIGGIDQYYELHFAGTFYQQLKAYIAAPTADFYPERYDPFFDFWQQTYLRTWKINQSEIDYHLQHWFESDYRMPEVILHWPGNGPTEWGVAERLAPFGDRNGNGIYEPELGDFPIIKGDQAILSISRPTPGFYTSHQFALDILTLVYAYAAPTDSILNNTVFFHHTFINRDPRFQMHDTFVGYDWWFELGNDNNEFNDQLGTDSTLNMVYSYKSNNNDAGINSFYPYSPALGFITLNRSLYSSMYRISDFTIEGYPEIPEHYYYNYQALFKDGETHLTEGGSGYSTDNPETNFFLNGYVRDSTGWSAIAEGWVYSSNSATGAVYCGDFIDTICMETAMLFACDYTNTDDFLLSVDLLLERSASLQDWYAQQGDACLGYRVVPYAEEAPEESDPFAIYPNPFNSYLSIEVLGNLVDKDIHLSLYNTLGQLVDNTIFSFQYPYQKMDVQIPNLSRGMYLLVLQYDDQRKTYPLIHQ